MTMDGRGWRGASLVFLFGQSINNYLIRLITCSCKGSHNLAIFPDIVTVCFPDFINGSSGFTEVPSIINSTSDDDIRYIEVESEV